MTDITKVFQIVITEFYCSFSADCPWLFGGFNIFSRPFNPKLFVPHDYELVYPILGPVSGDEADVPPPNKECPY